MKNMMDKVEKARNLLENYIYQVKYKTEAMERLETLKEKIQSPNNQKITGMPGSHEKTDISDFMAKIEELEENIDRYNTIIHRRIEQINILEDKTARTYLILKYIKGYTMAEIGQHMKKSTAWAKKYHKKALLIFAECNGIKDAK